MSQDVEQRTEPPEPGEADFRALADMIPQLAWIADGSGHIVWYNRRWYDYTGSDFAAMRGWGWRSVHHPDHVERVVERITQCFKAGEPWEDTFPLRRHDGAYRWFLSRAVPLRDESGRITRWFGTNTDITEQLETEERLRRSEQRFRAIVDASADIIWTAPASGKFAWPQPRWSAFTGQSFEALRGTGWLDAVHPEDREATEATWRKALAAKAAYTVAHRLRRHDGQWRYMEGLGVPILDESGDLLEWVGIHTDVTERKLAEAELAAARDAAEEANRAKSQFIANMSHELRTPLSAVIGYTEMLEEDIEELGQKHLLEDLGKITANARHLLDLINDVLDLSKIEAGRMTVTAERFTVRTMLDEVMAAAEALAARNNNRLEADFGENLGEADTDQIRVRQCLLNLLSNAAKFTESGTIRFSARREDRSGTPWLRFEVRDSGIGMTREQLAKLFQRFSQADPSTTRQFGGSGLGLAITRAFCRMLGGDVTVESEKGRGSVFTIEIPAVLSRPAAAVSSAHPGLSAPLPSGQWVLVIDDDPSARELLTRFLRKEGFSVQTAENGRMGLALARELRPRVVLLDVEMPEMNGWTVLHAIRSDPVLAHTPVVMVSVVNEKGLGYALGATDYLVKPISWDRLKATMDRFRGGEARPEVLIVDDDPDARARLATMLSRDGWTIAEAGNGRQALVQVEERMPSLILLDLMMPIMNGFEFLATLRARPGGAQVPVVVLTAHDVTGAERAFLEKEAEQVVIKGSISLRALAGELRELISRQETGPAESEAAKT
jgi:PAS domain S-box-containing protein